MSLFCLSPQQKPVAKVLTAHILNKKVKQVVPKSSVYDPFVTLSLLQLLLVFASLLDHYLPDLDVFSHKVLLKKPEPSFPVSQE